MSDVIRELPEPVPEAPLTWKGVVVADMEKPELLVVINEMFESLKQAARTQTAIMTKLSELRKPKIYTGH